MNELILKVYKYDLHRFQLQNNYRQNPWAFFMLLINHLIWKLLTIMLVLHIIVTESWSQSFMMVENFNTRRFWDFWLILPCYRLNHLSYVILSRCVLTTSEDLAWTPETRWFWSFWWSCKKIKRLVFSLQVQHNISDSSLHRLSK